MREGRSGGGGRGREGVEEEGEGGKEWRRRVRRIGDVIVSNLLY